MNPIDVKVLCDHLTEIKKELVCIKLIVLQNRQMPENGGDQKKHHVTDQHTINALKSLLTLPCESLAESLAEAVAKEFKQKRVKAGSDLDVSSKYIKAYRHFIKAGQDRIEPRTKRISMLDLIQDEIISKDDIWYFDHDGRDHMGRITHRGRLEVNGKLYLTPSAAGVSITGKACSGWTEWQYCDSDGNKKSVEQLRKRYRDKHNIKQIQKSRRSKKAA